MSDKLTLNDLSSLANEASAIASINSNNAAIETALDNTLSRDGTSPNEMGATLDMDSNAIINLPEPQTSTEPVRLIDLDLITGVSEDAMTALTLGTVPKGTRTYIKTLDTSSVSVVYCNETGREGFFQWKTGDYSTQIALDTYEGIFIKANSVLSSAGSWVRVVFGPVYVSWFGAVGDETPGESTIIQSAVTVAGVGKTIKLDPGKTYSVWSRITLLDDQTFDLNGSTLKMCNQPSTTTTQSVTSATTSFTVNDASAFRVGMAIVLAKQGVARASLVNRTSLSTSNVTITSIISNTITISSSTNITTTFASGSTVTNAFIPVHHANRTKLINGTIDGNQSNRTWSRWEVDYLSVFPTASTGCLIENVVFKEAPAEGVGHNGTHNKVSKCQFLNLGGNGIHFSAAVFPVVEDCYFNSGNLDLDNGHGDGAVIWSNSITHATVVNCYMTGFLSGLGSFDDTDTDATVAGNTITGNKVWGMYLSGASARLILTDNRITNNQTDTSLVSGLGYASTGGLFFNSSSSTDFIISNNQIDEGTNYAIYCSGSIATAKRLLITDNEIIGKMIFGGFNSATVNNNIIAGPIKISSINDCLVSNNQINMTGFSDYGIAMYQGTLNNIQLIGNNINGGVYGISLDTGPTSIGALLISNNILENQTYYGIILDNTTATMEGIVVSDNFVRSGTDSLSTWIGIMSKLPGSTIRSNEVFSDGSSGSRIGIYLPSTATTKAVVVFNTTRGSLSNDINIAANMSAFVSYNYIDNGSVTDATGNTVSNNQTI